jgi:VWFA-related protein
MRVKVEKVVGAAHQAMQVLRRGDRVSVMTFNTSTRLVSSFTDDLSSVERDIEEVLGLRFGGGTRIHQAVYDAANNFQQERRTQRRRVVLIITDNLGTRTRSEMSVIRNMWEADALLSGLVIPDHWFPVRKAIVAVMAPYALLNSGKGMDNIAEKTGGDTIRTDDPGAMFPEMMRRIRNRYSLYYPMPEGKPGEWRSIRAELTPETQQRFPGARVVARRGYRLSPP